MGITINSKTAWHEIDERERLEESGHMTSSQAQGCLLVDSDACGVQVERGGNKKGMLGSVGNGLAPSRSMTLRPSTLKTISAVYTREAGCVRLCQAGRAYCLQASCLPCSKLAFFSPLVTLLLGTVSRDSRPGTCSREQAMFLLRQAGFLALLRRDHLERGKGWHGSRKSAAPACKRRRMWRCASAQSA